MDSISTSFAPIKPIAPIQGLTTVEQSDDKGFKAFFSDAMAAINQTGAASDNDAISIMTGTSDSPHNVLISTEEARISLDLALAVRTKVIDAYNEIMRMQV